MSRLIVPCKNKIKRQVFTWLITSFICSSLFSPYTFAQEENSDPFANLSWRSIGPVNMSGRVADVEGVAGDPNTIYVGAASGGIWKSTNAGMTFKPIFDEAEVASIGDLGLAPSNRAYV